MTRRDTSKVSLLHRDGGPHASDTAREPIVEEDAPGASHHEDLTGQILAEGLRSVERGSAAERALLDVVDLLVADRKRDADDANGKPGGGGGGGGHVSPRFVRRIAVAALMLFGFVQPAAEQTASRFLSPSSAIERKLDQVIASQASLRAAQQDDRSVFISLAKWVVDCELARESGMPMPDPPAPVRLILVQDEMTRSTGM